MAACGTERPIGRADRCPQFGVDRTKRTRVWASFDPLRSRTTKVQRRAEWLTISAGVPFGEHQGCHSLLGDRNSLGVPRDWRASPSGRPGGADPDRIERTARRHEQAAPAIAAEADIRAALRQVDAADRRAGLIEDQNAVEALAAGPPAPQIAVHVEAQAVATALFDADEHAAVGEPRAVVDHVV